MTAVRQTDADLELLSLPKKRRSWILIGALVVLVVVIFMAVVGPLVVHETPAQLDVTRSFNPPVWAGGSWEVPLGTDDRGRDMLVLLVYGARVSITVAFLAIVVAGGFGTLVGLISGYFGGWTDSLLSRIIDAQLALPEIIIALATAVAFGPSLPLTVVVIAVSSWVPFARVVRSEVLSLRTSDYVSLAKIAAIGPAKILGRHVLPNVLPSVIVLATLEFGKAILLESTLSFLGLGVQPPATSWGLMIAESRNYLATAWWLAVIPGTTLALTALAANIVGDALRDRLDPSLQEVQ